MSSARSNSLTAMAGALVAKAFADVLIVTGFAGVLTVMAFAGVLAAMTLAVCWDDEFSDLRQNMGNWV